MSLFYSAGLGNAIPDGGMLHGFDFSSSSPKQNLVSGNADLSGSYTGTTASINGTQAGRFDNSNNDYLDCSFAVGDATPADDYLVFEVVTTADNDYILDGGSGNGAVFYISNSKWTLFAGSNQRDGSEDTVSHLVRIEWRSGNDVARLDGTDVIDADAGSPDLTGLSIASKFGDGNYCDVNIGEWRLYDPNDGSYDPSATYQGFADKWGITVGV